jgi:hypothetical protein
VSAYLGPPDFGQELYALICVFYTWPPEVTPRVVRMWGQPDAALWLLKW